MVDQVDALLCSSKEATNVTIDDGSECVDKVECVKEIEAIEGSRTNGVIIDAYSSSVVAVEKSTSDEVNYDVESVAVADTIVGALSDHVTDDTSGDGDEEREMNVENEDAAIPNVEISVESGSINNIDHTEHVNDDDNVDVTNDETIVETPPTRTPPTSRFNAFIKLLAHPSARDIVGRTKRFIDQFLVSSASVPSSQQQDIIATFMADMSERISGHALWRQVGEDASDAAISGIEKIVTTKIYDAIFSPSSEGDNLKDIEFSEKLRKFSWVTAEHLDIHTTRNDDNGRLFDVAESELLKVDTKRAPQDKLMCIMRCSKALFSILRMGTSDGTPAGADEFLPLLIFMVLKTAPTRFQSNMLYIQRFSASKLLETGETAYYFTNWCCVLSFLDNISMFSLSITKEEYDHHMGLPLPSTTCTKFSDIGSLNDSALCTNDSPASVKMMRDNFVQLSELRARQLHMNDEMMRLHASLLGFRDDYDWYSQTTPSTNTTAVDNDDIMVPVDQAGEEYQLQLALALSLSIAE